MKKIIKYITENIRPPLIALLALFIAGSVIGQAEKPLSEKFKNIAKPGSTREWLNFWQDSTIKPQTFFAKFKDAFELSDNDQMTVNKIKKDELGYTHFRYQQYYNKHKVIYGEYIVHQQPDSLVRSANGRLITGLKLASTPSVSEKQALDAALRFMITDRSKASRAIFPDRPPRC